MNKSELKAIFINAKATDAKYIGVSIQTEGSSQPEIIINPNANFDAKFDYYMEAYDDDLILIAAKGNGSKCGLSYWNVNNPATNVNTNIVASQSYQIMEHLTKSTPFSYTAGC